MKFSRVRTTVLRHILGARSIGLATVALASAAGIFSGTELYLAIKLAAPSLVNGMNLFWPVVLSLIGLALDVGAATVAVIGGGVMCLGLPGGRRLVIAGLASAIAGEAVLAFVDQGQYTLAASVIWIGLLLTSYVLLMLSSARQRRA